MKMLNVNINGNKKLVNNDQTRFIIWNMPADITCPFATDQCKKSCYAKKAERVYPSVLPSRQLNFNESRDPEFAENMIYTIEQYAAKKSFADKKIIFRIHESGDFYNQTYADAWIKIADHFAGTDLDITFMAYTKSIQFFVNQVIPENMVVRFSIWNDTSMNQISLNDQVTNFPVYTAVSKDFDFEKYNYSKCDCSDCANCGKCWDRENAKIACIIH